MNMSEKVEIKEYGAGIWLDEVAEIPKEVEVFERLKKLEE